MDGPSPFEPSGRTHVERFWHECSSKPLKSVYGYAHWVLHYLYRYAMLCIYTHDSTCKTVGIWWICWEVEPIGNLETARAWEPAGSIFKWTSWMMLWCDLFPTTVWSHCGVLICVIHGLHRRVHLSQDLVKRPPTRILHRGPFRSCTEIF